MADEPFFNEPIDVSAIPQLADEDFVSMDPNFLRVSLIGRALFLVVVVVIAGLVLAFVPDVELWMVAVAVGVFLLLTIISVFLKVLEVRNIGYQVREHDLSYRNGVIVKRVQTVPFVRAVSYTHLTLPTICSV